MILEKSINHGWLQHPSHVNSFVFIAVRLKKKNHTETKSLDHKRINVTERSDQLKCAL